MASFSSFDGCRIAFRDTGAGPTVVLLHGSLVDASLNWQLPGVTNELVGSGFRVVAADARGDPGFTEHIIAFLNQHCEPATAIG